MPGPPAVVGKDLRSRPMSAPLPTEPVPETVVEPVTPRIAGTDLARAAEHYLTTNPVGFRSDCSGFVCAAANLIGLPLDGNTAGIWEIAKARGGVHHRKRPNVGDLVFFDQTYDRNRNGRLDDELTHIAIVVEVHPDGRLLLAHGGTSRGRTTLWMNLLQPDLRIDAAGVEHNGYLRGRKKSDSKRTKYLSGELWRGFATVDPAWFDTPDQTAALP